MGGGTVTWGMGTAHVDDHGHTAVVPRDLTDEDRRRAQLTVARNAVDREECRALLDMLGLLPSTEESAA